MLFLDKQGVFAVHMSTHSSITVSFNSRTACSYRQPPIHLQLMFPVALTVTTLRLVDVNSPLALRASDGKACLTTVSSAVKLPETRARGSTHRRFRVTYDFMFELNVPHPLGFAVLDVTSRTVHHTPRDWPLQYHVVSIGCLNSNKTSKCFCTITLKTMSFQRQTRLHVAHRYPQLGHHTLSCRIRPGIVATVGPS
jgi:hypothetical protein